MKIVKKIGFLLIVMSFFDSCNKKVHSGETIIKESPFQKITSSYSGINFQNTLKSDLNKKQSVFHYDYFYSGSGVGIADLDNDGLQDIFFAANQVDNRLYRNKGNMQFEDVSAKSNINVNKGWANGVTFVDINNDELLDIYVCQAGPPGINRRNKLYINKGNMRFDEEAEAYGLNDPAISTQAAFFDYDKDGDLDCFVMNENPFYGVQPDKFYQYLKEVPNLDYASSSHLFERRGNKYYDVTKPNGLLKTTFGLGLAISDINNDGWQDIYVANDYYIPDALYINQKGKGFKDEIKERMNHISYYSMGMDIADVNNDGKQDVFTLDMAAKDHFRSKTLMASMNVKAFDYFVNTLGFQHQYMFNTLQLNNGNNTFSNIGHTGLAKTDWSWSVLIQDFDNDTDKDIFITNGIRKNGFDNDYRMSVKALVKLYGKDIPIDSLKKIYASMPSSKLKNVFFENSGKNNFVEESKKFELDEPSFSNGAAYGDLDNDGDLDLVVNNIDQKAFLYKNTSIENNRGNFLRVKAKGKLSEAFPKIIVKYGNKLKQIVELRRVRGFYSSVEDIAHFGLGNFKEIDTLSIEWPSGYYQELYNIRANQVITLNETSAILKKTIDNSNNQSDFTSVDPQSIGINYKHKENEHNDFLVETLLPYKQSTLGPFITKGDLNGDGQEDIFIGGAKGQPGTIYLKGTTGFKKRITQVLIKDKDFEDMESLIFDFDTDGDNDLLIISGGNEYKESSLKYADRLYMNDGQGNLTRVQEKLFKENSYSGKSVSQIDYDKDGDPDLIIGNRMIPKKYPRANPSFIFKNNEGTFKDVTNEVAPELATFGAINKVISTDFNNDGWMDFMAVGEWTGIGLFENKNGTFTNVSKTYGLDKYEGWWLTVAETDINNDGFKDYIVGNLGLNSKYKTTQEKPLRIYAGDFDANGVHDMMLSYEYKGEYVPLRGFECSSGQVPMLTKKFPTYDSFALANVEDLFGADQIKDAYQKQVTEFRSLLLINNKGQSFTVSQLPTESQLFPVMTCALSDVNNDGFEDVILAGGIYNTDVETPRLDAGIGQLLLSDGEQGYKHVSWEESGIYVPGNVKSSIVIKSPSESYDYIIFGKNNDELKILSSNLSKIKK